MIGIEVGKTSDNEELKADEERGSDSLAMVLDWYNTEGEVSIFTHEMVDADAAFSAARCPS